jgi:hypothetical protein
MKKKILHICTGLILAAAMTLPSCDLLEQCGECQLVTKSIDGELSYGTFSLYCGDSYLEKVDSEITQTIDGEQYWYCE